MDARRRPAAPRCPHRRARRNDAPDRFTEAQGRFARRRGLCRRTRLAVRCRVPGRFDPADRTAHRRPVHARFHRRRTDRIGRCVRGSRRRKDRYRRAPGPSLSQGVVHERFHVALQGMLALDRPAGLRPGLQQTILETAHPLRHRRHGAGPFLPRKQHLPAAQTPVRRADRPEPEPHARAQRPAIEDDSQQHPAAGVPGSYHRLLRLFHRRRGGQLLHQRRFARQESHDAGLHLPRRDKSTTKATGRCLSSWAASPR